MESNGLPIPIGGSDPLSAILLELSSRRFTNPPPPPQNMLTNPNVESITSVSHIFEDFQQYGDPITDYVPVDDTSYNAHALSPYASFGTVNDLPTNIVQNYSNNFEIHEQPQTQHSDVFQQTSGLSPAAAWAQMNMPDPIMRINKRNRNAGKQPQVEQTGSTNYWGFKPGTGVERLNQYMFHQRNRPKDNSIQQFWWSFVAEFFAPGAKKSWCVSSYKNTNQIGDDLKMARQCEMCKMHPCYGFEINGDVLPQAHKIKYDFGVVDEHLHFDAPNEYVDAFGHIILHFSKATEETEYHHSRIARYGQLRVVFTPDFKICSWEFCARHHEHIPRNSFNPQVGQLGNGVQNYQIPARGAFSVPPPQDMIVSSAYQMVEALGMSYLSQIGLIRQYVQCFQISEPNIMSEWMDYSLDNRKTSTESTANFTCFGSNVPSEQRQQSPSAPYFSALAGPVTEVGFCDRGLSNTTATTSTSIGPNSQKRQRTCPNNPHVGFSSSLSSGHLNLSCAASTPSLDMCPLLPHTPFGESGQQSAASNLHMEAEISPSDEIFIERIRRAQQNTGAGISENQNGSNVLANITYYDDNSNRQLRIDVENYEVMDNGSALASGMTASAEREEDVLPRNSGSNYLPQSITNYDGNSNRNVHTDVENYEVRDNGVSSSAADSEMTAIVERWEDVLLNNPGSNYLPRNISDGNSNRTVHIDVENNEVTHNGVSSSAPDSETTVSVERREDVFPRDSGSSYLPKEYDDHFHGEFMGFEGLPDLLN